MRFACLGYMEDGAWERMSEAEQRAVIETCNAYDNELRRGEHFAGGACLESAARAKTLSYRDGEVVITDGPFSETKEVLGGVLFLEAESMESAVRLMEKHPGVKMGPFEIRPLTSDASDDEEAVIRGLIEDWVRALEAKDPDQMMEAYLPEAVLYDAIAPYKHQGRPAIVEAWRSCLPYFPERFRSEHRDLVIEVGGTSAVAYGLHRFVPEEPTHPSGQTWMRFTTGWRKLGGRWWVSHEHVSVPFNPMTNEIWKIRDPEILDMPDYGSVAEDVPRCQAEVGSSS